MTNFTEAKKEALEFLRTTNNNIGVIATVDSSGQPFASPVYYVMGEEFDLFFLTTTSTNKAKNIEHNSKVAFSAGAGPEFISVMIRGEVTVTDTAEQNEILPIISELMDKNEGYNWPVRRLDELKHHNLILYKLSPKKVTFLNINSTQEPKSSAEHLYHLLN